MFETWIVCYTLHEQLKHIQPPEPLCNTHSPDTHSRSHEKVDAIVV